MPSFETPRVCRYVNESAGLTVVNYPSYSSRGTRIESCSVIHKLDLVSSDEVQVGVFP